MTWSQESEVLGDEVSIGIEEDGESDMSDREGVCSKTSVSPQYVGLGSDNRWYMFTGVSVRTVYKNALLGTANSGGEGVGTLLKDKLQGNPPVWKKAGESGSSSCCAVWTAESQAETLAWASQVPPLHELGKEWQVLQMR